MNFSFERGFKSPLLLLGPSPYTHLTMAAGTNPKEKEEEEEEEEEEEKEEEEEEEEEEKEEEEGVIICAQGRKGGMKKVFFSPCPDSLLRTFRGTPLGPARERRRGGGRERVTPTCPHTVHRAKIYLQEQVWLKKVLKMHLVKRTEVSRSNRVLASHVQ